jgi:hypothetical protein
MSGSNKDAKGKKPSKYEVPLKLDTTFGDAIKKIVKEGDKKIKESKPKQ